MTPAERARSAGTEAEGSEVNAGANSDWFDVVEDVLLEQGDVLKTCPIPIVAHVPADVKDGSDVEVSLEFRDLIVLTQSCDLINPRKVDDVLLARVVEWHVLRNETNARANNTAADAKSYRAALVQGNLPGYSLLRKLEPHLPWSVVDFRNLHVVAKSSLTDIAAQAGPRLRMRSPYREHLSQAFARYFMRVGLPHDAKEFVEEGAPRPDEGSRR